MMVARPAGKKPTLAQVLDLLESLHGLPFHSERPEDPLLDHLLVGVLATYSGLSKAREALRALSASYLDFNAIRGSPKGEIQQALAPFVPAEKLAEAAWDLRMALQDVYDGTHGLDLEPLRGREPEDLKHFLTKLPNIPGGPAAMVVQMAVGEDHLVLGPLESHLLERLGMLPRAATPHRVRVALERQVKPGERLRFAWVTGAAARMFEKDPELDPTHPFVKLLIDCRAKELADRERRRKEEEVRKKAEAKRLAIEAVKKARLDAIAQKKREAEEKKKAAQDAAKKKREEAVKAQAAKKAAEKARSLEAQKKKQEAAQEAKKKQQEAAKAAAAAKKAAEKAKRDEKVKRDKEAAAKKAAAKAAAKKKR
jgi:hypothetical protein